MPGEAEKKVRDSATHELQRVRELAKLAHELRCEITAGPYTVRPVLEASPVEPWRALLANLKAPVLAFFDKL